MRKKLNSPIIIAVVLFLSIISSCLYYFIFTSSGSSLITKLVISKYVESRDIDIKSTKGSLSQKLIFQDIEIENLKWLPKGSIIKIKKLGFYFTSFNLTGLNIEISNGRLILPDSESILFYGSYKDSSLDINTYSNYVNVKALLDMFFERKILKGFSGTTKDIDIYVKGTFLEPTITGELQIQEFQREGFLIFDCPTSFNLSFKGIKEELKIYGELNFSKGEISGTNTATVTLNPSKVSFNGSYQNPSFNIRGTSNVEKTKINITLKGTMSKPELILSSEPPMPQERLMVMLVTNKSWKGAEESASRGQISADLAADFIDYFAFGGTGSRIAQQLGISEISLKFDKETKGIDLKKEITSKSGVTYGIEQTQTKEKDASITQKVGGEYKVTETISVGAEREFKQDNTTEQTQDQDKLQTEDKVLLKYKKEF